LALVDVNPPISVSDRDWTTAPIQELIQYLSVDEHNWFRQELSDITRDLQALVETNVTALHVLAHLPEVFAQLSHDLEVHMFHEEKELFPVIERYVAAADAGMPLKGSPLSAFGGPLRVMEHEHETAGAALRLMREFTHNYTLPADSSAEYAQAMSKLMALEDRLLRHIYLENNVLYPRAAALKATAAKRT